MQEIILLLFIYLLINQESNRTVSMISRQNVLIPISLKGSKQFLFGLLLWFAVSWLPIRQERRSHWQTTNKSFLPSQTVRMCVVRLAPVRPCGITWPQLLKESESRIVRNWNPSTSNETYHKWHISHFTYQFSNQHQKYQSILAVPWIDWPPDQQQSRSPRD